MKSKPIIYVVAAAVVLLGLFLILKPKQEAQLPQQTATSDQQATVSATPESNIKTFELIIQNKKLVSGPSTIEVKQGDEVTLKITSDEVEELHVHAYDNFAELMPNEQATLTFVANISGRFPFELEKSKVELGAVEVTPK